MDKNKKSLTEQIGDALQRITDRFLRQCKYGAQTTTLPKEFAACGQFIGDDAETIAQHGLHGISAALRVLGPCQSEECKPLVYRIVSYCEANFGVHPTLPKDSFLEDRSDTENVIKLGELLYGLSFVTTAQAERDRLVKIVSGKLNDALQNGKGWGYFLGDTEPQLLPTAYAARGLAEHGFDISGPREFILEALTPREGSSTTEAADLTTAVACTYCLTFSRSFASVGSGKSTLRSAFRLAWRSLEPLLAEDIEQNLEYWRGKDVKDTCYVRIPWQLYLLALAAEYSLWRFGGFRSQRRIRYVINALQSGSFKYPYSGKYVSSRTYAVAYDALEAVRVRVRRLIWLWFINLIDRARVVAGSRFIRIVAAGGALLFICIAIKEWLHTGRPSDVAPELIASLMALILSGARK